MKILSLLTNNTNRWYVANDGHFRPDADQTYDIGSTAQEVRNVYAKQLNVQDDGYIRAGDSSDLQIYHNGTDSFLKNTTGNLIIGDTTGNVILQGKFGEDSLICKPDGAVELFHDNSKKLETTSTGVKIDGGLLEIAHTSCHIDFMESSTTNHRLRNGSGNFHIQRISDDKNTTTTQFLVDGGTGAVQLYHDGSQKLETTSYGTRTTGYNTQSAPVSWMAYGNNSYTTISAGNSLHPYIFVNTAHNIGSHYNTTTGKFTCPVTGVYQMNYNLFCKSDSNQTSAATIEFYVKKNGNSIHRLHQKKGYGNMGDDQQIVNLAFTEQFSANDEITLFAQAVTVDWKIYGGHTTFSGHLIG
jgi:hypothetical protein